MKVDVHTHILPRELPRWKDKFGYGGFVTLEHNGPGCARMLRDDGAFFRDIASNCWDPAVRLTECARHGVDIQVLSTVPVMFSYFAKAEHGLDIARFLNDDLAATVATHPRRFVGLATLPMQAPELAVRELERAVTVLGLAGAQIGSHVGEWNLDEPSLFPVFQAAEALGAAIFVHPWDMLGAERMKKYWLPWLVGMPAEVALAMCSMIFGGVLERLPGLRVAFAHGGGSFPGTLGRIEHGFHARPDLCAVDNPNGPRSYLNRIFVDSLVHDPEALRFIIKTFGSDHVALGTDYPFPLGENEPGTLIDSLTELTAVDRERLLSGSALAWLGRRSGDFAR